MKKFVCFICKKESLRWVSALKNTANPVCSKKCVAKLRSINNFGKKNGRYNNKAAQVSQKCENCKKQFCRYLNPEQKNNKHNFCCHKCYFDFNCGINHYLFNGGKEPYGYMWSKQQSLIKSKYKQCLMCGRNKNETKKYLHVHHYIPFRCFKKENADKANHEINLGLYCVECHIILEKFTRIFWTTKFFDNIGLISVFPSLKNNTNNDLYCYSMYK